RSGQALADDTDVRVELLLVERVDDVLQFRSAQVGEECKAGEYVDAVVGALLHFRLSAPPAPASPPAPQTTPQTPGGARPWLAGGRRSRDGPGPRAGRRRRRRPSSQP